MITETPYAQIPAEGAAWADLQAAGVLAAVAAGNSRARLWVSAPPAAAVLLWDQANNVLYGGGAPAAEWAAVLAEVRAAAVQLGRRHFGVRGLGPGRPDFWLAALADTGLAETERRVYVFRQAAVSVPPADLETRFELITGAWLAGPPRPNLERVRAEVAWMWPSLERFAAHGFGVAAVRGETVVCWCTAEYVGAADCGLGIETDEAWQGRGLATAAAARAVAHSLSLGRRPHWECAGANLASRRVAEKLGFELALTAPLWVGRFA